MTFDAFVDHASFDVQYFYRVPVAKMANAAAMAPKPHDNELSEWLSVVADDGLLFPEEHKREAAPLAREVEEDVSTQPGSPPPPQQLLPQAQHWFAGEGYAHESSRGGVKRLHSAMSSGDETVGSHKSLNRGQRTAMEVFQEFTKVYADRATGHQVVDVRSIISRECYEAWLESRKQMPVRPEECFRKCILAHITATDGGSAPFPEPVETALLDLLRQRGAPWPCFQGCKDKKGNPMNIGHKGLRASGYHEKRREEERANRLCML